MKLLFICKQRYSYEYCDHGSDRREGSYGITNSCNLIKKALEELYGGDKDYPIECKVVTVVDNNDIDREVFNYKPTHVFIEALWVVPSKFAELLPLHPRVQWAVRVHSKTPFLANEGIAFQWLNEYRHIASLWPNFCIAGNDREFVDDIRAACGMAPETMVYLPNLYPGDFSFKLPQKNNNGGSLNIGCFGAIRPLKNQLQQALAAVMLANESGRKLRFHMNGRTEQGGGAVLNNIQELVENAGYDLVLHGWHTHSDFLELVKTMDAGLQVSLSESFNIVAADFVMQNVPIVVSPEIKWASELYKANPNCANDIRAKLSRAIYWRDKNLQYASKRRLETYNQKARGAWLDYLYNDR